MNDVLTLHGLTSREPVPHHPWPDLHYMHGLFAPAAPAFSIASLFAAGQQGACYEATDLSTLFQDTPGTTPLTTVGQQAARMLDKSGWAYHATQDTASARPILQSGPLGLALDKIDDCLLVTLPAITGTTVLGTDQGTAAYGFSVPAGSFKLGGNSIGNLNYYPGTRLIGQIIRDGAMTAAEISGCCSYLVSKGSGPSGSGAYAGVTVFDSYWRSANWITSFPMIDTSAGTSFRDTWLGGSLTSFPPLDCSAGINFRGAWYGCGWLVSFPLVKIRSAITFRQAWWYCGSLTSFAANFFDSWTGTPATNCFLDSWVGCFSMTNTSVENILVSIAFSGRFAPASGPNIGISYNTATGGLTGPTLTAIATLKSRNWVVIINGATQ